jgi:ferredoxin
MKTLICYFSGTGNTKKVVDKFAEEFEKNGCEITLTSIEKNEKIDFSQFDAIGIAYPIHAFNAPSNVVEFCKKMPKMSEKKQLFIIKSSGEPLKINNISSTKIKSILRRKNYYLTNEYHFVMPYNMIFRHSNSMAYRMWHTAEQLIPIDCKEIIEKKKVKLSYFPCAHFIAWVMRIEHWGGRFNGKKYRVSDKCLHCQQCVRNCPVHNITIDEEGNFHFGNKCLMCMRCSMMCPVDAFKIGWFNGWKVNGRYNFNDPNGNEQASHKNFCKHSYKKYFARSEEKIKKNS